MEELIKEAKNIIDLRYEKNKHTVGAAIKTKSGKIYTGICINVQKVDICSEWTAVGKAFSEGEHDVVLSVAIKKYEDGSYKILPPCGLCRELYVTYAPGAEIIISEDTKVKASDLLPHAWKKKIK